MKKQKKIFLEDVQKINKKGNFKSFGYRIMNLTGFFFKKTSHDFRRVILESPKIDNEFFKVVITDNNIFLKELFKSVLIKDKISKEELKEYLNNIIDGM